jgi:hypothetical protein
VSDGTDAAIEKLEAMLANARPVPLTDQVRIDLHKAQLLLYDLREQLAAERRRSGGQRPTGG